MPYRALGRTQLPAYGKSRRRETDSRRRARRGAAPVALGRAATSAAVVAGFASAVAWSPSSLSVVAAVVVTAVVPAVVVATVVVAAVVAAAVVVAAVVVAGGRAGRSRRARTCRCRPAAAAAAWPLPNLVVSPVSIRCGKSSFFRSSASAAVFEELSARSSHGVPAPNMSLPLRFSCSSTWSWSCRRPRRSRPVAGCRRRTSSHRCRCACLCRRRTPRYRSWRWTRGRCAGRGCRRSTIFFMTPCEVGHLSAGKTRLPLDFSAEIVSVLPVSGLTRFTDLMKCAAWCTPPLTIVATPSACSSGTTRYWPKPTSLSK